MISVSDFNQNYWEYFLELEDQLADTKKYIEFDSTNNNTETLNFT